MLRWPATIPWAVVITAAGYVVTREGKPVVDGWAAVIGVLLLVSAELSSWSIDHDSRVRSEPSLVVGRVVTLATLAAAALLVNFVLLAAAAVSSSAGVLIAAVGVAAAVTAVAVVLRLVRSSPAGAHEPMIDTSLRSIRQAVVTVAVRFSAWPFCSTSVACTR